MTYDMGDQVVLAVTLADSTGAAANATLMQVTVTAPDASITGPTTVTASPLGSYSYMYSPSMPGRHNVRWVATGANAAAYQDTFEVRALDDIPLVSLADAKAFLNITGTTYDDELRRFLDAATDTCERYAGRALRRRTYTENLDGSDLGANPIVLQWLPVLAVTSVQENGVTIDPSMYVLDDINGLLLRGGQWSPMPWQRGRGNVTVTYQAGYADPPPTAIEAVLVLLKHTWETQRGAMDARSVMAGETYDPRTSYAIPYRVREKLDALRIPAFG